MTPLCRMNMGAGLSMGKDLVKKHATKQIDRLLSNDKFDTWQQAKEWVAYLLEDKK